jgi:hypothetical protein
MRFRHKAPAPKGAVAYRLDLKGYLEGYLVLPAADIVIVDE